MATKVKMSKNINTHLLSPGYNWHWGESIIPQLVGNDAISQKKVISSPKTLPLARQENVSFSKITLNANVLVQLYIVHAIAHSLRFFLKRLRTTSVCPKPDDCCPVEKAILHLYHPAAYNLKD